MFNWFCMSQPMIAEPRNWTKTDVGGYLSMRTEVVRTRSQKHLNMIKHADMSKVYASLNYLGGIPWFINKRVLAVVENFWDQGGGVAGLPSRNDVPMPPKPADNQKDNKSRDLWKKYKQEAWQVEKLNKETYSLRCDAQYKIEVAQNYVGRRIYFPCNIDFRGRAYPLPPHLNHLGSDLSRSLLLFHEGKPLGPEGLGWLKIHLANMAGRDKLRFEDRVAWVNENLDMVLAVNEDPTGQVDKKGLWWLEAEEPLQCLATCLEIGEAIKSGDPASYISRMPVHMDGSCNGLQHYGALGRDREGGAAVNLSPSVTPQDVYAGVLTIVNQKIEVDAEGKHPLAELLRGNVTRKVVKQTVMTSVYGVTMVGARQQVYNRLRELDGIDWPSEKVMNDAALYLAKLALSSLGDLFSSAQMIMDWLADVASLVAKQGQEVSWVTPLGLPVLQPYKQERKFQIQTLKHKLTISDSNTQPVSTQRQKSAFPPNFVHSLDATHMFMTALDCQKRGLAFSSVHDSYWTHAATMEQMNESLREQFVRLYSQPILEDLHESLSMRYPSVRFPPVPRRGNLDLASVRESLYFFA
jgi:DNA-directed RNA polymerase